MVSFVRTTSMERLLKQIEKYFPEITRLLQQSSNFDLQCVNIMIGGIIVHLPLEHLAILDER